MLLPHLSSSGLVLNCVTFSRASKGPLRCRRWTFESSPITGHHLGHSEFLHPLHATLHKHMFPSSSTPTYIGPIQLDVRLTNTPPLQTCSSALTKKLPSCAVPFALSYQAPCQASFPPLPLGLILLIAPWRPQLSCLLPDWRGRGVTQPASEM